MNNPKTVKAVCSCDYAVTVTNEGCKVSQEGTRYYDAGKDVSICVGVDDAVHCSINHLSVSGVTQSSGNVRITNIDRNYFIHAICKCYYLVVPSSATCMMTPSEAVTVEGGGSVRFDITPIGTGTCWVSKILVNFVAIPSTNSVQRFTNI